MMNNCPHCGSSNFDPVVGDLWAYICLDCERTFNHGEPDLDRRLCDGFALSQACEDDEIVPARHLGRGPFYPEMDDPNDFDDVVGDRE